MQLTQSTKRKGSSRRQGWPSSALTGISLLSIALAEPSMLMGIRDASSISVRCTHCFMPPDCGDHVQPTVPYLTVTTEAAADFLGNHLQSKRDKSLSS